MTPTTRKRTYIGYKKIGNGKRKGVETRAQA